MSIANYPNELNEVRRAHQAIDGAVSDINLAVESILPDGEDIEFDKIMARLGGAADELEYWIGEQSK